ncbi:MAG: hypothetical protein DPW11_00065 [bacterium]|nr:prepilin-type N-terminal cleavage/methylation domain-containing protein [Candidatus Microgenomates bacterium CPR3]MCQ3944164.1 hypothetical protein [bacterium]RIK51416.1 MAG: hypothetical protein DCC61_02635 [Candidatus Microgenomates bacterium]
MIKRGFTLIELLIVITIIGILSALVLTNVQGVRERARDARRKSDLNAIKTALRLYYNDFGSYPTSTNGIIEGCSDGTTACTWGSAFASTNTYMNSLPLDPSSTTSNPRYYTYTQTSADTYTLTAELENASDPDAADSQARCGVGSGTDYVVCE